MDTKLCQSLAMHVGCKHGSNHIIRPKSMKKCFWLSATAVIVLVFVYSYLLPDRVGSPEICQVVPSIVSKLSETPAIFMWGNDFNAWNRGYLVHRYDCIQSCLLLTRPKVARLLQRLNNQARLFFAPPTPPIPNWKINCIKINCIQTAFVCYLILAYRSIR